MRSLSGETTDSFQLDNSKYSSSFCCLGIFFSHPRGTHTQRDGIQKYQVHSEFEKEQFGYMDQYLIKKEITKAFRNCISLSSVYLGQDFLTNSHLCYNTLAAWKKLLLKPYMASYIHALYIYSYLCSSIQSKLLKIIYIKRQTCRPEFLMGVLRHPTPKKAMYCSQINSEMFSLSKS